jgi:transcriptional regulator with XRE-family HTH domain
MARGPKPLTPEDHLFAAAVKRRRDAFGLTQRQLGARVGLPERQVYKIEAGERHVSRGEAIAIARVFGVAVEDMTEAVSPAAIRAGWKSGDIVLRLEQDLHNLLSAAQSEVDLVAADLGECVREIDELPHVDDATERFYAETLSDALTLVVQFPEFVEQMWATLQNGPLATQNAQPKGSGSVALGQILSRVDALKTKP